MNGSDPKQAATVTGRPFEAPLGQIEARLGYLLRRANLLHRMSAMLEKLGTIERRRGHDRRSNALWLTDTGSRLHDRFIAGTIQVDRLIASDLSAPECETSKTCCAASEFR